MLKSNQNSGQLGWHGIGTWSTTQINVTWNTYEGRSPVNAVGYIAVCKVQEQWGRTAEGNNLTTQYPIAFTSFCILAVAMCSSNSNAADSVFRNGFGYTAKSLTSWTFRGATGDAAYYFDYIAAGK